MKKFRKIGSLLLAAMMVVSLAACGGTDKDTAAQTPASGAPAQTDPGDTDAPETSAPAGTPDEPEAAPDGAPADENAAPEETPEASGSHVLVAYFSGSGNTRRVAEDIASAAGADLFEITPTEPYTADDLDWTVDGSRVNREHDDESLRDVPLTTTEAANWDDYDTVFIGYPIWWGIAAWPVNNFVKDNDFTGKTVIPFATSASSGMGSSGTLLEEMAGTGDWQDGRRFSSGVSQSDVTDWVSGLGLNG